MRSFWTKFAQDQMGQDMVEYSLLLGFIAMAGVSVYQTISNNISTIWNDTNTQVQNAANAANAAQS